MSAILPFPDAPRPHLYCPPDDPEPDPPDLQALRVGLLWLVLAAPCDDWPASAGRLAILGLRAHYHLPLFVAGDCHLSEIEASRAGYLPGAGHDATGAIVEEQPNGQLALVEDRQPCLGRRLAATLRRGGRWRASRAEAA